MSHRAREVADAPDAHTIPHFTYVCRCGTTNRVALAAGLTLRDVLYTDPDNRPGLYQARLAPRRSQPAQKPAVRESAGTRFRIAYSREQTRAERRRSPL